MKVKLVTDASVGPLQRTFTATAPVSTRHKPKHPFPGKEICMLSVQTATAEAVSTSGPIWEKLME